MRGARELRAPLAMLARRAPLQGSEKSRLRLSGMFQFRAMLSKSADLVYGAGVRQKICLFPFFFFREQRAPRERAPSSELRLEGKGVKRSRETVVPFC